MNDLISRKELLGKIQDWEKSITKRDWVSVNVLDTLSSVKNMVNNLEPAYYMCLNDGTTIKEPWEDDEE